MEALDSFILNTSARVGSAGSIVLTPSAALISRTDLRTAFKDPAAPSVTDTAKLTVADLIVALGPYMALEAPRMSRAPPA